MILLSRSTSEQKKESLLTLISSRIRNTSAEVKKEIELQIGHVLLIDVVGYSKFSINEQNVAPLQHFNDAVDREERMNPLLPGLSELP